MTETPKIVAIAIGRNEGERLKRCLRSLIAQLPTVIYVDSGSDDGSREFAASLGTHVIDIPEGVPFTAALARNTGYEAIQGMGDAPTYIQFIDGDCEMQPGWLSEALAFLEDNPDVAVACGRRRERFPDASLYNWLADKEWDTPVGYTKSCGGDSLMRVSAFEQAGGFRDSLIAGEEPELCVRLRQNGWKIYRLGAEMTLHDANITRFSQWWKRNIRSGHAYLEGFKLHGGSPENHFRKETLSATIWVVGSLLVVLLGIIFSPYILLLLLIWPIKTYALGRKLGSLTHAAFLMLSKFPEVAGFYTYLRSQMRGKPQDLIEYK